MENPTSSSLSSVSSYANEWTYDVFISFRGVDTRSGFTGNLYSALCEKGIKTFLDDGELQKGAEITPTLVKAIQESRIAIVVFSKNYASSSFCLEELVNIMECSKDKGTLVLPVFYQVDPSDVRHQNGSYAEALAKHEARIEKEKIDKWRLALKKAADLSGSHYKLDADGYEYKFIGSIIQEVSKKINLTPLHVAYYQVGLKSRVQKVNSLLNIESDKGVDVVGIYGIDGIGKTTLACAVYNSIADQFESLCFLDEIRKNSMMQGGLVQLQERLLYELVGEKDIKLWNVNKGISIIKNRLSRKKVLLILDDVDKLEQLRALAGELDWFGSGSRIVITTRNKDLLRCFGVASSYEAEPLNCKEVRELFSWHVFRRNQPLNPIYLNIFDRVKCYCNGLPLSLEMISSDLFGKTVLECNSTLDNLKIPCIPHKDKINCNMKKEASDYHTVTIKVALDADLYDQIGNNIILGLVDYDKVRSFLIEDETPFILFKTHMAVGTVESLRARKKLAEFGIPIMYQRFWFWEYRHGCECCEETLLPQRLLTPQHETETVGHLRAISTHSNYLQLKLFLESEIGQDFRFIPPPKKSKEDLLLFFKLYDPSQKKLRYIGRFYVKAYWKPMDILTRLNEMAGFAPDEEIELFKEKICENATCHVDKNCTFCAIQVVDCDIICFQKVFKVGSCEQLCCPDLPSFSDYVCNHQAPVPQMKSRRNIIYDKTVHLLLKLF